MTYFDAGLMKLRDSGPSWITCETLQANILEECLFKPNGFGLWFAGNARLCKLLSGLSLFFELSFPLVLVFPALILPYGAIGVLFHVGVFLTMKVDFIRYWSANYLVFAVLLVEKMA
jgi:hypothetical protein